MSSEQLSVHLTDRDILELVEFTKNKSHAKPSPKRMQIIDWKPMSEEWQNKLLTDMFYIQDTIGDGNCQFRAISAAGIKADHKKLRQLVARHINKMPLHQFKDIVHNYVLEQQNEEFEGGWDPSNTKTKKQFIEHLKTGGFHFQGDDTTLALLSKTLNVDFIIFDDEFNINNLANPDNLHDKIICLYYADNHYQTVGIKKKNKIQCLFKRNTLPQELVTVLNKKEFFLQHINFVLTQKEQPHTVNSILKQVQDNMQHKLGRDQKKLVLGLMFNANQKN